MLRRQTTASSAPLCRWGPAGRSSHRPQARFVVLQDRQGLSGGEMDECSRRVMACAKSHLSQPGELSPPVLFASDNKGYRDFVRVATMGVPLKPVQISKELMSAGTGISRVTPTDYSEFVSLGSYAPGLLDTLLLAACGDKLVVSSGSTFGYSAVAYSNVTVWCPPQA